MQILNSFSQIFKINMYIYSTSIINKLFAHSILCLWQILIKPSYFSLQVISARKGEFETGFDRGGQTREHAMLAKTAGVKYLVVLVNKMDDPTVNWDVARYNECKDKILPYLKKLGWVNNKGPIQ